MARHKLKSQRRGLSTTGLLGTFDSGGFQRERRGQNGHGGYGGRSVGGGRHCSRPKSSSLEASAPKPGGKCGRCPDGIWLLRPSLANRGRLTTASLSPSSRRIKVYGLLPWAKIISIFFHFLYLADIAGKIRSIKVRRTQTVSSKREANSNHPFGKITMTKAAKKMHVGISWRKVAENAEI